MSADANALETPRVRYTTPGMDECCERRRVIHRGARARGARTSERGGREARARENERGERPSERDERTRERERPEEWREGEGEGSGRSAQRADRGQSSTRPGDY